MFSGEHCGPVKTDSGIQHHSCQQDHSHQCRSHHDPPQRTVSLLSCMSRVPFTLQYQLDRAKLIYNLFFPYKIGTGRFRKFTDE